MKEYKIKISPEGENQEYYIKHQNEITNNQYLLDFLTELGHRAKVFSSHTPKKEIEIVVRM